MNTRPILFSGPMVRALLEGRKTQTRRDIKAPTTQNDYVLSFNNGIPEYNFGPDDYREKDGNPRWRRCPYGLPGDLLWVRETWAAAYVSEPSASNCHMGDADPIIPGQDKIPTSGEMVSVAYRADFKDAADAGEGYFPSIHMPRWASRLTLRIKDVRVERLQDIGQGDACAEGAPAPYEPIGWYSELWDSINGAGAWAANSWVWVVEFEVIKANVDDVLRKAA